MGKNWRGGKGKGRGGHRGGDGDRGVRSSGGNNSLSGCRQHSVIVATCDTVRERESNKELTNMLNVVIDEMEESGELIFSKNAREQDSLDQGTQSHSVEDMLAAELDEVRNQKSVSQRVMTVNTGIKGVIVVKLMRSELDPIVLVTKIFEKIEKDKQSSSRHLCKLIPLKYCFFPKEIELEESVRKCMRSIFPGIKLPAQVVLPRMKEEEKKKQEEARKSMIAARELVAADDAREAQGATEAESKETGIKAQEANKKYQEEEELVGEKRKAEDGVGRGEESAEPVAKKSHHEQASYSLYDKFEEKDIDEIEPTEYPNFTYEVAFKKRNHNTLTTSGVLQVISGNLPPYPKATSTYTNPNYVFAIEALKNLGGISIFDAKLFKTKYLDFNIRKFSELHCATKNNRKEELKEAELKKEGP